MREATIFALFLAILMGLFAVTQLDSVATNIQAVTTGPLNQFVSVWPFLLAVVVVMIVVGFAISVISRR